MNMIGALLIDKPAGITSHDAVAKIRRALKCKRVGHTGTLDPFATGLLIICLGRATRLTQFLTGESKEYEAVMRLGFSTDTQDYTGKPVGPISTSYELTVMELRRALSEFIGEQWQLPPMFSAKKVAGETLYRIARRGETVERQSVRVFIDKLELATQSDRAYAISSDGACDIALRVRCSAGTYIRTLAHDIGERLGCGAHLVQLRRIAAGRFSIADADPLDRLLEKVKQKEELRIIRPADMVAWLPSIVLAPDRIARIRNGQAEHDPFVESLNPADWVRLLNEGGELVAMSQVIENENGRRLQPRILLID